MLTRGRPFGFARGPLTTTQTGPDAGQNSSDIFRQDRRLALPDVGSSTRSGGIPTRQQCGAESVSRIKQGRISIPIILYPAFRESLGLSISGGRCTEYHMDTRLQHRLRIITSIMCGYVWLYFIHLRPCFLHGGSSAAAAHWADVMRFGAAAARAARSATFGCPPAVPGGNAARRGPMVGDGPGEGAQRAGQGRPPRRGHSLAMLSRRGMGRGGGLVVPCGAPFVRLGGCVGASKVVSCRIGSQRRKHNEKFARCERAAPFCSTIAQATAASDPSACREMPTQPRPGAQRVAAPPKMYGRRAKALTAKWSFWASRYRRTTSRCLRKRAWPGVRETWGVPGPLMGTLAPWGGPTRPVISDIVVSGENLRRKEIPGCRSDH